MFKAIKPKLICEEYDKHLIQSDPEARRLLVHENRLIVKDGILRHKNYEECGQATHHQTLLLEHLTTELLIAIDGQMGKRPGITKMIQECRSKHFYPRLAKRIKQWVLKCEDGIEYIKSQYQSNRTKNDQQYRTRLGTGRYPRD